jgi:hypothetical protein
MDYVDVLKRAWKITWKYKALWVLGLFAGASSGSGNGGNSYRTSSSDFSSGSPSTDAFTRWIEQNWVAFAIVAAVLVLIGIAFWILSVAAQGGLVWGANEAAEDRKPSLGRAWSVGFSKWGRTFMIGFVLGLPAAVLAILMVVVIITMVGGGALLGSGGSSEALGAGVAAGALGGLCCVLPIFVVLIIVMSVVLGIIYPLALRYGILNDITFGQAIKRGWGDLRGRRGAFVFWLIMLLPGFAAGIVMLLILLPLMVPAIALFIAEKYVIGAVLFFLAILVMMLPSAIYGTFASSAWTVFFRKMTGLEPATATAMPGYPPAPPTGYAPPAPPAGYAAPAPPVVREPMAPPAPMPEEPPIVEGLVEPPIVDVPQAPAEEAPPADE